MKSNKNVIDTVIQTLGFNGLGLSSNSSELVTGAEKEHVLKTLKYKSRLQNCHILFLFD
jgi:hypothetical protein